MFYLACTRFNNETFEENKDYREKNAEAVIYGTSLRIRNIYPIDALLFVAEMNNNRNCIEGIGLIRNSLVLNKRHKIYQNPEYNRYVYRGNYWLSRQQIELFDKEIIEVFDLVLFKGKSHLKCRTGITVISDKLFAHWDYELTRLKNKVKQLFLHYFMEIDREEVVEVEEIIPKKRKI